MAAPCDAARRRGIHRWLAEAYHGDVPLKNRRQLARRHLEPGDVRVGELLGLDRPDGLILQHRRDPRARRLFAVDCRRDPVLGGRRLALRGAGVELGAVAREVGLLAGAPGLGAGACRLGARGPRIELPAQHQREPGGGAVERVVGVRRRRVVGALGAVDLDRADQREVGQVVRGLELGEVGVGGGARGRGADLGAAGLGARRGGGGVGQRRVDRGELGVVDVGVGDVGQDAQRGEREDLALAGLGALDLGLGEQGLDPLAVLDRDAGRALGEVVVEGLGRGLDPLDAVVEHPAQLARQLDAPVGARDVDRDVAGGGVLERGLRGHAVARGAAGGADLAERVQRLDEVELGAAEHAGEVEREVLGRGAGAVDVVAVDLGRRGDKAGQRAARQALGAGLVEPGAGGVGVGARHLVARAGEGTRRGVGERHHGAGGWLGGGLGGLGVVIGRGFLGLRARRGRH
jgi:hypothetical protein